MNVPETSVSSDGDAEEVIQPFRPTLLLPYTGEEEENLVFSGLLPNNITMSLCTQMY